MSHPLRVIIVEDSEDDTLLILRELRRGGYTITHERVSTDAELSQTLSQSLWDLVIADYSLPHFSAPAALQLLQAKGLDIPFIVVSGSITEDTAVTLMKAGAHDYLMKYNLARLVPVVERELREAQERRQRIQAEQCLQENQERFRTLIENALDIIVVLNLDGVLEYVSPSIARVLGYQPTNSVGKNAFHFIHADDQPKVQETLEVIRSNPRQVCTVELQFKHQTGSWCVLEAVCQQFVELDGIVRVVVNARDISERKRIEAELQQLNQALDLKVQERTRELQQSQAALQQSQNRLSLALESANAGLWDWDLKTNQGFWSEQNFKLLGYEPGNCQANLENWLAAIHPDDRKQAQVFLKQVIHEQTDLNWEYRVQQSDGSVRWLYSRGKLLLDEQGNPKAMTGIQIDVTARKQAESILQQKASQNIV